MGIGLGNNIRRLREERGETLRELAAAVSMDWAYLSRIERGLRFCPDEKKVALAEHFGIGIADLFFQPNGDFVSPREASA